MKLKKVQVTKYRSIKDSGLFEVEDKKTILVGPNEAGKTALLRAMQQINPTEGTPGFNILRDYPRSELNEIDIGRVDPKNTILVEGHFSLDEDDKKMIEQIDPAYAEVTYIVGRHLDNSTYHNITGGPAIPTYASISKDLLRLGAYTDKQYSKSEGDPPDPANMPSRLLEVAVSNCNDYTAIKGEVADGIQEWLKNTALPNISESNSIEQNRFDKILDACKVTERKTAVLKSLSAQRPVFVYYSNYFRVRPRIHLRHLADRVENNLLDDDQYDYGNLCLLKLLGFTPRELSDLGTVEEPDANDAEALRKYQDQLDTRDYRLNAASVRLTEAIQQAWQPDPGEGEKVVLRVKADQQYLKVVVEDDLGVEVELDQRSEGFQWLVSFFVVFFADAQDRNENAILLLDEPGMSLHGLKQRDFRTTISQLSTDNQLIYTTHSPFLVGPSELDLVRVVEMGDRRIGTLVHTTITADSPAALLPLQEALGYDLAQSLFMQESNLVCEGLTDYWYLEATSALLRDANIANLNEKIAIVPAHSAGKVVYYATILHAHSLKVAALLDSDNAGDQAANQEILVHTLGHKRILRTKDAYRGTVSKPEIEELLRDTLVAVGKDDLGWEVESTATAQPNRSIVDIFANEVTDFSKYKLAKAYLRWCRFHEAGDLTEAEREQWQVLVERINKSIK